MYYSFMFIDLFDLFLIIVNESFNFRLSTVYWYCLINNDVLMDDCRLEEEVQEYNAYHQALQDTEKWILQTSFHLMAHNSMFITTREQTEEQIAKHNVTVSIHLNHSFESFINYSLLNHFQMNV